MNSSQQAYKLEFEQRPRYAYGRLTAPAMTMENADRYVSEIADNCARLRTHGLLIERRVRRVLSRVLAFHKISQMIDNLPAGTAIALVDRDPEARNRFEWAISHSIPHTLSFRVFASVAEAERWLLSKGDGSGDGGRSRDSGKLPARKGRVRGKKPLGKQTMGFLTVPPFMPAARSFTSH